MKPTLTVLETTASLKGNLTIRHFDALLQIAKELETSTVQTLLIDSPEEIDLTAIQLVWSISSSRRAKGQTLKVGMALADNDIALLRACGLSGLLTPLT